MHTAPIRSKLPLRFLAPFLLLALLFAGTDWLAMRRVSQLRAEAENLQKDMLADIDLVTTMRGDLYRVHLLADRHVFEKEPAAMAALEARIAQTLDDYDAAVAQYESMPLLPGEEVPWLALQAAVADIRPRLDAALVLSRRNEDVAAGRALGALEDDFNLAATSFRDLIAFNRRTAAETVNRVAQLQGSSAVSLQGLALAGVALSVFLGVAMTRALELRNLQLRHDADRLAESNRELDAFAGRVAHDLRGPLTAATLASSRLAKQSLAPEQGKTFDTLQRSHGRMGAIIEDLLAISRVRAGESLGVSDPAVAAEQLREEIAPRIEGADVWLVIDVQPAKVRCAEGLLRQVLWNLTDNAMKYSRVDVRARVEVCGRAADDGYVLSVRDNGIGIAPDDTGKVFDAFFRAEAGRARPGTGLGLSIVKRAVEANGGTVSVTSEVGTGSTFVARLPLA
jgi:signal transduction histidine kinase